MRLSRIVEELGLEVRCAASGLDTDVRRGYASDLMSDVMVNTNRGDIWITLQTHLNTVAIAAMKELAAIVLINGRQPEAETLAKAEAEGIPILTSSLPAFELIGRLYEKGISGNA